MVKLDKVVVLRAYLARTPITKIAADLSLTEGDIVGELELLDSQIADYGPEHAAPVIGPGVTAAEIEQYVRLRAEAAAAPIAEPVPDHREEELARLTEELEAARSRLQELPALNQRIGELGGDIQRLNLEIGRLTKEEQRAKELDGQIAGLRSQLEQLQTAHDLLKEPAAKAGELARQIEQLNLQIGTLTQERDTARQEAQQHSEALEQARGNLQRISGELEEAKQGAHALREQLATARQEAAKVAPLIEACDEASGKSKRLEKDLKRLRRWSWGGWLLVLILFVLLMVKVFSAPAAKPAAAVVIDPATQAILQKPGMAALVGTTKQPYHLPLGVVVEVVHDRETLEAILQRKLFQALGYTGPLPKADDALTKDLRTLIESHPEFFLTDSDMVSLRLAKPYSSGGKTAETPAEIYGVMICPAVKNVFPLCSK